MVFTPQVVCIQGWRETHPDWRQLCVVADEDHLLAVIVVVQVDELEKIPQEEAGAKAKKLRLLVHVGNHRRLVNDVDRVRREVVHAQLRVELERLRPLLLIVAVLGDIIKRVDSLVDRVRLRLGLAGDHLRCLPCRCGQDVVAPDGTEIFRQALRDEGLAGACVALEEEDALSITVQELPEAIHQFGLSITQVELGKRVADADLKMGCCWLEVD